MKEKFEESSDCQEAVQMQIAIVAMELRQESKAKDILESLKIYDDQLAKWDSLRKERVTTSLFSYLSTVIYSAEVFKRLMLVAPVSAFSKLTSRLTLSRKSASNVQCAFCSMKCFNSDIKCEKCAEHSVLVWYCTIECKNDHLADHVCGKARTIFEYFPSLSS